MGLSLLAVASIALFTSCGKDKEKDTKKPDIVLHGPEKDAKVQIGKGMHFEADFVDWGGKLASYKVNIHDAFDGHSHSAVGPDQETTATRHGDEKSEPFSFDKEWKLDPLMNAHIHHHEIMIKNPSGKKVTPGKYHIVVYCADVAGNQSHITREITLVEPMEHEPDADAHFHIERLPQTTHYYATEIISCELEAHSEKDPVKQVRIMLLPTSVVEKGEAEWQAAATPEKCFAVLAEISDKNQSEVEIEGALTVGEEHDNAGGTGKGKKLNWGKAGETKKYVLYAAGETVGGKKFYLKKEQAKILEITYEKRK